MKISFTPSPNFNERKTPVDMIVLHYTGMPSGEAALQRMCDPAAEVSAHFMVWEDGRVIQLVGEDKRAWHAGVGSWQGDNDLNSCSIGIEIVNGGHDFPDEEGQLPAYPDVQIESVIALCDYLRASHIIPPSRIVGHSDIAPARKADPGEHFPWKKLADEGIGLFPALNSTDELLGKSLLPGDTGTAVSELQTRLAQIGYGLQACGVFDDETAQHITAFQRRWVPSEVTGRADLLTQVQVTAVAAAYAASAG